MGGEMTESGTAGGRRMLVEGNRTNREGDRGERMWERTGQRWTNNDPRVCFNN